MREFPADPNVIDMSNANQVRQIAILIKAHRGKFSHLLKLLERAR
jgi:hypothetical protein